MRSLWCFLTLCVMPFVSTALPHSSNYTITGLQWSERETVMTSRIEGLTGLGTVGGFAEMHTLSLRFLSVNRKDFVLQ
jgi:hypothetical protein